MGESRSELPIPTPNAELRRMSRTTSYDADDEISLPGTRLPCARMASYNGNGSSHSDRSIARRAPSWPERASRRSIIRGPNDWTVQRSKGESAIQQDLECRSVP